MSYRSNVTSASCLFAGEDKTLSFEIYDSTGVTMEDVSAFDLRWELRRSVLDRDPLRTQGDSVVTKTSIAGITVTGIYNPTRELNTQRVLVAIADTDTAALAGGRYVHALKRMDDTIEHVLSHGTVELLVAATR